MAEIKTPLRRLEPGETYKADEDGAYVIEDRHTLNDIRRHWLAEGGDPED